MTDLSGGMTTGASFSSADSDITMFDLDLTIGSGTACMYSCDRSDSRFCYVVLRGVPICGLTPDPPFLHARQ